MLVEQLQFRHFRNLEAGCCKPGSGVNIFWGDNAQGKTNLLEAVWLFTGGRSFRGAKDAEMVGFGCEKAQLTLDFHAEDRPQQAEITIQKRRSASLNGIAQSSAAKLAGHFCAVVFSPVHLGLIKEGPEGRRRFIDAAYCQLRPAFFNTLTAYQRTLSQRNALLKSGYTAPIDSLLDVWDSRLAQIGSHLMQMRAKYVAKLAETASVIYDGLSGGKEQMELSYVATVTDTADYSAEAMQQSLFRQRAADVAAGFTTVGPHRDDMQVMIGGVPARLYASQGQQRSAVLALKLAEASLLKEVTGEQPVALLDDVMSELDISRQDFILHHIDGWQVFITCCDPSPVSRLAGGKTFHVKQGVITAD